MTCPRIVIGGVQSGVGKTSLALAAVAALRRRGLRVQTFKVGPDFLDPTYLALASGRPCYNLDGWMMGREYVARLFARAVVDADFAVIEGVMGLFDGADAATLEGSTAEIAKWLKAPVVLVANVHGMARSLAALVGGYAGFEKGVKVGGVIANQCGSERHAAWLKDSLAARPLPPLLGAVPRGALPELPSRHLGLVTADGRTLPLAAVDRLAEAFERHVAVEGLIRAAGQSKLVTVRPPQIGAEGTGAAAKGVPLGVARDAAFHFYYQDLFDELASRGCRLRFFSPLTDSRLPRGIRGLLLGGGYPEEHAEVLSANDAMISAIRKFAASGRPVYAECGGLMVLSAGIETREGKMYPMAGLLPAWTRMLDRRKSLGYAEVVLKTDSLWGAKGNVLRGHEFHYSELKEQPQGAWKPLYDLKGRRSSASVSEGFQLGRVAASYVHLHLASRPAAMDRFLRCCGGEP